MALGRRRWIVIAAGIAANACCGAGYAFSVIKAPLMKVLSCTDAQVAMAYTLSVAFLPVGMLLSGAIASRRGPGFAIGLGGLVFGAGMFAAGFSSSLVMLYATYGVMVSLGQGLSYGPVIATAVKWFPDRKGLASGLVVSALGVGTLVVAPLYQSIMGSEPVRVLAALKVLGVAFVIVIGTASRFITDPPERMMLRGEKPLGASAAQDEMLGGKKRSQASEASKPGGGEEVGWRAMLARPYFWTLFALYVLGTLSGHMVLTQAAGLAQTVTGLTAGAASVVVGIMGVANAGGRLLWGGISDRIGRLNALAGMFVVTGLAMLFLSRLAESGFGLMVGLLAVGLCYGGNLGTFPSLCADAFGSASLAVNYALLFAAFSVAALAGPRVGALLLERTHDYSPGFTVAAGTAGLGVVLSVCVRLRRAPSVLGQ